MDSLPLPLVSCLYRPSAPTRNASAAVGELIAVGSTSPGFCGASNSALTRSQPAMAIAAPIPTAAANRVRFTRLSTGIELQYLRLSRKVMYVGGGLELKSFVTSFP